MRSSVELAVQAAVDRALENASEAWPLPDPMLLDTQEYSTPTSPARDGNYKSWSKGGPRGPRGRSRTPSMPPFGEVALTVASSPFVASSPSAYPEALHPEVFNSQRQALPANVVS